MTADHNLAGVYPACPTPLYADFTIDLDAIPELLNFLGSRGSHGVLLFGTTGEGPSFSRQERLSVFKLAAEIRVTLPAFKLLAGTGTASLDESVELTRAAFDRGFDGVVVLPPYYFRNISDEGLFQWFDRILRSAVPKEGSLLGYHIPKVSGVPLSIELLSRLKDAHPERFAGLKDSSGDVEYARLLGRRFGRDLIVFNGNDSLLTTAMESHASGCITAMANLLSPELRRVWDASQRNENDAHTQGILTAARSVLDRYPPFPPLIKYLLWQLYNFPYWPVRPPLLAISEEIGQTVVHEFANILSASSGKVILS